MLHVLRFRFVFGGCIRDAEFLENNLDYREQVVFYLNVRFLLFDYFLLNYQSRI